MTASGNRPVIPGPLTAEVFRRRFRNLVLLAWTVPPVFGLSFIVYIGILTPAELAVVLSTPLEPAYALGWLVFALWYLPRYVRPVYDFLASKSPTAEQAEGVVACLQGFPLRFWGLFLLYLALAPSSVILSAEIFAGFEARPVDWFRIHLVALIVSIIVGLPIFFLIFDLFGRAASGIRLRRPVVSIRAKVFLIGALVPLLIDTMLVQYFWTRTGYFTAETFLVWLTLELLAIAGSLIFVRSFAQSLQPLQGFIRGDSQTSREPSDPAPLSTDELGVLAGDYRRLLDELKIRSGVLALNVRVLRVGSGAASLAEAVESILEMCRNTVGGDRVFLMLYDQATKELVAVAQTGEPYKAEGYFRLSLDETSLAVWVFREGRTVSLGKVAEDRRVNARLRDRFRIQSALAVPLRAENRTIGVLMTTFQDKVHSFSRREEVLLEALAGETALIVHTHRLRVRQEHSEQRIDLAQKAAGIGSWEWDIGSGRVSWSDNIEAMFGLEPGAFEGGYEEYLDLIHPDDRQRVGEAIESALQGGKEGYEVRHRVRHPDGRIHWLYGKGEVTRNDTGGITGMRGVVQDITGLVEQEQSLIKSTRAMRVLSAVNEAVLRAEEESALLQRVCRILVEEGRYHMVWIGYAREDEESSVEPVAHAGHEGACLPQGETSRGDDPRGRGPVATAIRAGRTEIVRDIREMPVSDPWRAQALEHGCLSSAAIPFGENGTLRGVIHIYAAEADFFDPEEVRLLERLARNLAFGIVTLRSQAVREQMERVLRATRDYLLALYETSPDMIFLHAEDGRLVDVNDNVVEALGYSREELLKLPPEKFMGRGFNFEMAEKKIRQALRGENPEFEWVSIRRDGTEFPVEVRLRRLDVDTAGGRAKVLAVVRDITERKRHESEIARYQERLEERVRERTAELNTLNKELESFSYSVSHDLRSPLRAIDGFSHALLEDYSERLDEQGKDYLHRVRAASQRMGELIDDLLDLSRVSRGEFQAEALDLSALAAEAVAKLRESDRERDVKIEIEPGLKAHGDRRLLGIVLDNLLGNAWKYTGGRECARIEFGVSKNNGREFFVRDNGVGFNMKYADKLFKPFQRLHKSSEFEGTGIGLVTVARIIHRHGGRIWAQAEPGKGAVFRFTLAPASADGQERQ